MGSGRPPPAPAPPAAFFSPLGVPCGRRGAGLWRRPREHDERRTAGRGPGAARDWAGAGEGLARSGRRGGLPGLGKGLEQKCFLFQRLPAWPGSTTPS